MAPSAQEVQLSVTPWEEASEAMSGLPAIAVRNMAQVIALTWPTLIARKEPARRAVGPGVES